MNYKIGIQYEGTRYDGWQKQITTENTIQGKLERILEKMCLQPVQVHGSGRTDSGVHAMGQVANFHLPASVKMEPEEIREYFNQYLPDDIAVISIEKVGERFHSRLNAKKKTYNYNIETGTKRNVFTRRMIYGLGKPLDVDSMKKAAELLVGTHDYKSFCGNKRMKKSTVRTVYSITVHQEPDSGMVTLAFVGNGFLQHMVRIMTGTLIEVGLGERSWQSMTALIKAEDRQAAGYMAPAEGLCLAGVLYD